MQRRYSTTKGFKQTGALVQGRIRAGTEARGFAQTRLLTHWEEIVGDSVASIALPVDVRHGRGLGATLTLLTTGSNAPILQAQLPQIRDKVNACYGYNAISKIRVTQTAPTGFADGQVQFQRRKKAQGGPAPEVVAAAGEATKDVADESLRKALQALGSNVLHKTNKR
ncbi:DUF721 domain-containing protein [Nereida sp. MMG025]|uniref:DUF721 domain-containing protein n=1 Tax=Nereida sp. MMG025 TaxID=2909981 RepID=UPI001F479023|nr:DUF721 domain-containing protein [Nereida sp. MMG025]MCF6444762.1 DUF721 domain-containing protein [Nereida sp. MMG025]